MNWTKTLTLSSAALAATLTYSQPAQADGLTGREFSTWSQRGQDGFISNSVVMANFIAGQINTQMSDCIGNWYFDDPRGVDVRNGELKAAIVSLPDYHPSAVLLAVIQKACGKFSG